MTTTGHTPDLDDIDELAVTMVGVDDMRMHGRIDTELITWRLYITTHTVHRVIAPSYCPAAEYAPVNAAA
jgi:hypothetical protein